MHTAQMLSLESKGRLPIPEFSGSHYLMLFFIKETKILKIWKI